MILKNAVVDVLMLTYNHEDFISQAIDSVISQTYTNWKLYIGVEPSKDKTVEIVKKYVAKYPDKIFAIYNRSLKGISKNYNQLLILGNGKYVSNFSGDDIMLPDKLKIQVAALESYPEASACYHSIEIFDSKTDTVLGITGGHSAKINSNSHEIAKTLVLKQGLCTGTAVFFRRIPGVDFSFDFMTPYLSDWLFTIDLAMQGPVLYLDKILTRYRRHNNNVTNGDGEYREYKIACNLIGKKYPCLLRYAIAVEARFDFYYAIKRLLKFDFLNSFNLLCSLFRLFYQEPYSIWFVLSSILNTGKRKIYSFFN